MLGSRLGAAGVSHPQGQRAGCFQCSPGAEPRTGFGLQRERLEKEEMMRSAPGADAQEGRRAVAWPGVLQRGRLLTRFSHHHVVVFLLTFFSYSLLHASRKTFSNVKVSISKQWTPSAWNTSTELPAETWSSNRLFPSTEEATLFLGTLDTIFLFSYAVGLFISGIVGDRLNLRWVLSFGMCSSALVVFVFGTLTEWLHFYNKWFYCGLWIVNGLLQSTGWPCVVAVMGNWFGKAGRGVVFGLWSACASVGNILGACLASSVLQYGYEYAFLVTASVQFAGGIVIFFGLLVSPEEIGLLGIEREENLEEDSHRPLINAENEDEYEPSYSIPKASDVPHVKAISFGQACCLPGVIPYSLAYACLKLVNYSFFFWLPFYLSNNFGWKEAEADKLSIWYDVGGIVGPEPEVRLAPFHLTTLLCLLTGRSPRCLQSDEWDTARLHLRCPAEESAGAGPQPAPGSRLPRGVQPVSQQQIHQRTPDGGDRIFYWWSF
ncbi:PREDICTED: sugar phosphate exchanger 3 isoform X3 [Chinchilla lanigera]|uniref:sugar phosphate exchanger 3 isoform X3 n=1 Tax=Chinchilla lanigera TaxID=34839 RepID=UPI000695A9BC|nr:PREDICTED: sugar phosphate exchanger 3 isoform X3 [Chinchilla lanigera]